MMLFKTAETVCFLILLIPVIYLGVFAVASVFPGKRKPEKTIIPRHTYLVLFPAYKEDAVIVSSVQAFFKQRYPRHLYDLAVISDQMQPATNQALKESSAHVWLADYENSSKTKALRLAIRYLEEQKKRYDFVVVMDADNVVASDFLLRLEEAFGENDCEKAIQGHRTAKNLNTDIAVLDAVSEEINNSIFRKGHNRLGLSASLIGSGMAFRYEWFRENIFRVGHVGEDKQIEFQLMKQNIYVEYLEKVYIQDEKVQKMNHFNTQRRRWIATQFVNLLDGVHELPRAIRAGNADLIDTVFQWMLPPRLITLGLTFSGAVLLTWIAPALSWKWWGMFLAFCLFLSISVPRRLMNRRLLKALLHLPVLFVIMFVNLFRVKGADKKFIHTEHSI